MGDGIQEVCGLMLLIFNTFICKALFSVAEYLLFPNIPNKCNAIIRFNMFSSVANTEIMGRYFANPKANKYNQTLSE